MINVVHLSRSRFFVIQKTLLFPALNKFYKNSRIELYNDCLKSHSNHFSGDGRCDSPGYSAKYGTYSLMNTETNKVIDFQVVHVLTAGNSNRMEKHGLEILLEKFTKLEIPITSLTTDRHTQVRAFMKKCYPSISHQFDIWHFAKSIKKKLSKLAKKSANRKLNDWIKSIVNHLWWCCATCEGNSEVLKEKWLSVLYHVQGIHSWKGNKHFQKCEHGELEKQRKWLREKSPAFKALKSVVENTKVMSDLMYLVEFRHTGNLEVYHSVINKYCPKRLHFSMYGMIARTQLAVLDFNSGMDNQQAKTKDGTLRYKQVFSRVTQSWVVKRVMTEKKREYLYQLLESTIEIGPDIDGSGLPIIGDIPSNIATKEKPEKSDAIQNKRTRFKS